MNISYVIAGIWFARICTNILTYCSLWYVKEYRFDRMGIHLRTKQGRMGILIPTFRRPPVSPKTIVICLGAVTAAMLGVVFLPFPLLFNVLIMDLFSFPITGALVLLLKAPTFMYHAWLIGRSVTKLRRHAPMTVIGITGSYGKTSTKEVLATILGFKYKTLKTEASKNSPIAIAELVLAKLEDNHQAFVVEMGAYKPGEIAEMCAMVCPSIAILTAINPQHQDLFGSIERTISAKYELISGLSGARVAVINGDDEKTAAMGERAAREGVDVRYYSINRKQGHNKTKAVCYADDIAVEPDGITFTAVYGNKKRAVSVPLLGAHQASNVIAAITAAVAAGMPFDEAVSACRDIQPFTRTMQPVSGINGAVFIDDTFNNNPDAAIAAVHFLAAQKPGRTLVFQPMIELGSYAAESHRRVGEAAGKVCDEIILTNDNFLEDFLSGVKLADPKKRVQVLSGKEAAAYVREHAHRGDTVLFKGKESARVLAELKRRSSKAI